MKRNIVVGLLGVLMLFSCSSVPNAVEELAGDNIGQLKMTLRHYAWCPKKYLAARYLIDNMGHGFTESSSGRAYRNAVFASDAQKVAELNAVWFAVIDSIQPEDDRSMNVKDASVIRADYLMDNIDEAFETWRCSPWKKQIGFRTFLRNILPYRVLDEPLCDWRHPLHDKYMPLLDGVTDLHKAFAVVYRELMKEFDTYSLKFPKTPDVMFSDRLMTGVCSQRCTYMISVMRALGIPAAYDGVHYWANYSPTGHSWVSLVPDNRHTLTMQAQDTLPISYNEIDASVFHVEGPVNIPSHYSVDSVKRASKVYRRSYEIHIQGFLSPFQYDVSNQYAQTQLSVSLPIKERNVKLYTFASIYDWQPAADPSHYYGNKIVFDNIGGHIVYLPVIEDDHLSQRFHSVSPPFILENDASIRYLEARSDSIQHLVLHRKYVLYAHWIQRWGKMIGAKFEASDYPDFSSSEKLYEVKDMPEGITSQEINPSESYRYVRMQVREDARPNVAELAYSDEYGNRVQGKVIAHDIDLENVNKATDDDYGTWSSSSIDHYWWGYDFGLNPPMLSRIEFCMRHDMNMVESGKRYELFYYDGDWKSLGEQTAMSDSLEWDAPSGALYWLRCLDGGREERIFTYENGRQVWW